MDFSSLAVSGFVYSLSIFEHFNQSLDYILLPPILSFRFFFFLFVYSDIYIQEKNVDTQFHERILIFTK